MPRKVPAAAAAGPSPQARGALHARGIGPRAEQAVNRSPKRVRPVRRAARQRSACRPSRPTAGAPVGSNRPRIRGNSAWPRARPGARPSPVPCPASSPQAMQTYAAGHEALRPRARQGGDRVDSLHRAGTARHLRPRRGEEEKGQGQNARQRAVRAGLPSRRKPAHEVLHVKAAAQAVHGGQRQGRVRRSCAGRSAARPGSCRIRAALWPQASAGHSRRSPPQNRRVRPASAPATCQPPESFFVCTDESLLSFILSLSFPFVTKILRLGEISCQFFAGFAPGRGGIFGRFLLTARGRRGYSSSWNPLISCKRPLQSGFSFYE